MSQPVPSNWTTLTSPSADRTKPVMVIVKSPFRGKPGPSVGSVSVITGSVTQNKGKPQHRPSRLISVCSPDEMPPAPVLCTSTRSFPHPHPRPHGFAGASRTSVIGQCRRCGVAVAWRLHGHRARAHGVCWCHYRHLGGRLQDRHSCAATQHHLRDVARTQVGADNGKRATGSLHRRRHERSNRAGCVAPSPPAPSDAHPL